MAEKLNTLEVYGADTIVLVNPKTTMAGFSWTGAELRHSTGRAMRFTPEVSAEIAAAVAASRPAVYEHRTGAEIQDGDRAGWEFVGVEGDAIGHYTRLVSPQVVITVAFGKQDLA